MGEELTRVANSLLFPERTAIKLDASDVLRTTLYLAIRAAERSSTATYLQFSQKNRAGIILAINVRPQCVYINGGKIHHHGLWRHFERTFSEVIFLLAEFMTML